MTAPLPQLVEGSRVARLIAQAVEQEREACAKALDDRAEKIEARAKAMGDERPLRADELRETAQWVRGDAEIIRARGSAA